MNNKTDENFWTNDSFNGVFWGNKNNGENADRILADLFAFFVRLVDFFNRAFG